MNSWYGGEMPENYIRVCCIVMLFYYSSVLLKASCWLSPVVCLRGSGACMHTHTHTVLMILHWAYEPSYLSLLFPLLHHRCRHFLSPIIYLHWATRRPPIPPCFCLPHWKGITVLLYSDDNAVSQRNISPCEAAKSACWEASLSVPFIEVITDFMSRGQEKSESGPLPPHHLLYIPLDVCFMVFPCLFVVAFTCKWCLIKTEEKLVFILSYCSA